MDGRLRRQREAAIVIAAGDSRSCAYRMLLPQINDKSQPDTTDPLPLRTPPNHWPDEDVLFLL